MIKIGIVGVGTIGSELALSCVRRFKDEVRLVGVVDTDEKRERRMMRRLGLKRRYSLQTLVGASDLVIEAATAQSAYGIAKAALSSGKDVMIMSAGGIISRHREISRLAVLHRSCVYLPSGAVSGLDGLKSASIGRVRRVSLQTRKPPMGFRNAPYIKRRRIRLERIRKETLLFDGSAEKAVRGFPQNINISATLSMAGLGARRTRVKIYATPGIREHVHEVTVEGDFGTMVTVTRNKPSRDNPKTSRLAVLSAVATLQRILGYVKIGT